MENTPLIEKTGYLDLVRTDKGTIGFLRVGTSPTTRFRNTPDDVYVSSAQITRFGLKQGARVKVGAAAPDTANKSWRAVQILAVNDCDPETNKDRPDMLDMVSSVPIFPQPQLRLATRADFLDTRFMDMSAPIGKGQRGMIVSPPKSGKTTVLKHIAMGIQLNHPEVLLKILLVGERPEEVTDMDRAVRAEIFASTFDEPAEVKIQVANGCLATAIREVETGRDVVILMDSMTRLGRVINATMPSNGRLSTGGAVPEAMDAIREFYGSARKIENGGSLTILATCLVDTGNILDEAIFAEFEGTGNSEVHLNKYLAKHRMFPAMDLMASWSRNEHVIVGMQGYTDLVLVGQLLANLESTAMSEQRLKEKDDRLVAAVTSALFKKLAATQNNEEFLVKVRALFATK